MTPEQYEGIRLGGQTLPPRAPHLPIVRGTQRMTWDAALIERQIRHWRWRIAMMAGSDGLRSGFQIEDDTDMVHDDDASKPDTAADDKTNKTNNEPHLGASCAVRSA